MNEYEKSKKVIEQAHKHHPTDIIIAATYIRAFEAGQEQPKEVNGVKWETDQT